MSVMPARDARGEEMRFAELPIRSEDGREPSCSPRQRAGSSSLRLIELYFAPLHYHRHQPPAVFSLRAAVKREARAEARPASSTSTPPEEQRDGREEAALPRAPSGAAMTAVSFELRRPLYE